MAMDRPPGRRFMSQGGGEPKWVVLRTGPLTTGAPGRVGHNRHNHHKHLGYVAILGVAAGVLVLICFYFCVWLIQQSRSRERGLRPDGAGSVEERLGRDEEDEKVRGSGGGEGEKLTWNVGEVELVLMAGENVPTFLAHPVDSQCPPLNVTTPV